MSAITKAVGNLSVSTLGHPQNDQLAGRTAGEAIAQAMTPCYIKTSDGKVYKSDGTTAASDASHVRGYNAEPADLGGAITLVWNIRAVTILASEAVALIGKNIFLAAGGGYDTAATTGGVRPIGWVVDETGRCQLFPSDYQ